MKACPQVTFECMDAFSGRGPQRRTLFFRSVFWPNKREYGKQYVLYGVAYFTLPSQPLDQSLHHSAHH